MTIEDKLQQVIQRQVALDEKLDLVLATVQNDALKLAEIDKQYQLQAKLRVGTTLYGYVGGYFDYGDCEYGDKIITRIEAAGKGIRIHVKAPSLSTFDVDETYEDFESWDDAAWLLEYTVDKFLESERGVVAASPLLQLHTDND